MPTEEPSDVTAQSSGRTPPATAITDEPGRTESTPAPPLPTPPPHPASVSLEGPIEDVANRVAQSWTGLLRQYELVAVEPFEASNSCLGTALPWLVCESGSFSGQRVLVRPNEFVTYEFRIDAEHGIVVWVPNVIVEGRSEGMTAFDMLVISGDDPALANTISPGYMEGPLAGGVVVPDPRALEEGSRVVAGSVGKPDTDVVMWVGVARAP